MGIAKISGSIMKWQGAVIETDGYLSGDMGQSSMKTWPVWIGNMGGFAIQVTWIEGTVATAGTLKLQANCDGERDGYTFYTDNSGAFHNNIPEGHWADIAGSSVSISDESGVHIWNYEKAMYANVRVVYTRTAGDGSMTAVMSAKEI